ncbi:MAG: hypothetical protein K2W95_36480 [Candidatus Obscuribacterales bacterium]|nr:hypothetical protein [Candidatus Obscuribacterales bacterium]
MIVVKHQYFSRRDRQSRAGGGSPKTVAVARALAHVKYIQHRPGPDRAEGGRELFNDTDDNLDGKSVRRAIRAQEENKVVAHKLTLAPEITPEDKKAFTREIMQQLSSDKGLDLDWVATAHTNTDHPHIHVVVLGKDKNGADVRFGKDDYNKIKEFGDRYLERCHPYELARSRQAREQREKERIEARNRLRETERAERIRDGLELPWMHRKIVREQLQPYEEWKKQQEKSRDGSDNSAEKPYFQDTIEAAGKEWSRENSLQELRELNTHLWDHPDERIDRADYKKLVGWMRDKEKLQEKSVGSKHDSEDAFEWKGETYTKDDSEERLKGLAKDLRANKKERLPLDDYQHLRSWIEGHDRAKFSGVIEKELTRSTNQFRAEEKENNSPEGGRYVDPIQAEVMKNPVVGVFMTGASIASTVVSWIDLRDNRDRLKETQEGLEAAKADKLQSYLRQEKPEDKERDASTLDKLERSSKDIEEARETRDKDKKDKEKESEKKQDPFEFDPWGRY